jgi:hypothetical protein
MKTILKLALVAVLLTAIVQGGMAFWHNFQFEDAVQQAMTFETNLGDEEVPGMVMTLAEQYQVPLAVGDITVRRIGGDRVVEMVYTTTIPLLPGIYEHEYTFRPRVSTRILISNQR